MKDNNPAELARQLNEEGYCVVEGAHGPAALAHQEGLLYGVWEGRGKPPLTGFGLGVHPLLTHAPEFAAYFDCAAVEAVLEAAFGDRPRLCHTGARIASEDSAANIGWHHHYGWAPEGAAGRSRIERVVVNYYVKGVSPAIGSLWAIPRRVGEPIPDPPGERSADWPGQVELAVPPGAAVILDTALYHTATRGSEPGMRYHWGGHYQGWADTRPHREDMDRSEWAARTELLARHPGLKRLLVP
ncbi:MAG: hypothetical protein IT369_13560 [Candidatus Latescibacteria bacterium]|nr:hypothetical protein [Candidatus Latescibacterota bacterium]